MRPDDPRVLAIAGAIVALVDAATAERAGAVGASDELVPLNSCGVERRTLRRLTKEGRLEVVRLGRKLYTTRRALAELVTDRGRSSAREKPTAGDPRAAARAAYAAPLRVVRGRP
jgi:hypothetical protein